MYQLCPWLACVASDRGAMKEVEGLLSRAVSMAFKPSFILAMFEPAMDHGRDSKGSYQPDFSYTDLQLARHEGRAVAARLASLEVYLGRPDADVVIWHAG